MLPGSGLEESAAFVVHTTSLTYVQIDILPVRDRLARERPKPAVEYAELVIVN